MAKRRYTNKSENIIRDAFNSGKSVYVKQIDINQGFHCVKINNHHELENALKTGSIIMSSREI